MTVHPTYHLLFADKEFSRGLFLLVAIAVAVKGLPVKILLSTVNDSILVKFLEHTFEYPSV